MEIAGKRALITGGSSGIGLSLARALIARGARVIITGRRAEGVAKAVQSLGSASGIPADVTTPDDRERMLTEAERVLGGLDILINNAGGVRAGRLENITEDEIRQMVEVNLTAPILLTRAALPMLRASGEALIVNISSGIGLVGTPFYTPYAAVKAGIAHFGEALRRELAGEGVGVLTVFPTATETPMMATSGMNPAGGRDTPDAVAEETIAAIASGAIDVIRGAPERIEMIKQNRVDPAAVDAALLPSKAGLEAAAQNHSAL